MDSYLSNNKIEYIIFHLNMTFLITKEIRDDFLFLKEKQIPDTKGSRIIFPMSGQKLEKGKIIVENDIPVLFPVFDQKGFYHFEGNNLVFHHDLLKSSFYLLSGYQELEPEHLDSMGRFAHNLSIQSLLGLTHKPIVNYYFQVIAEGIKEYCNLNNIRYEKRNCFRNFCFFLTHDVDSVDTYTIYEVIYRFKQAFKLAKPSFPVWKSFRVAFLFLINYLNFLNRKNPHWDFPFLREVEKKNDFRSVFFFLPKNRLHHDAYYSFKEKRIKKLFDYINREACEIGLHGTVNSSESFAEMSKIYNLIEEYSPQSVYGIRQHRLLFNIKNTPGIFEQVGFLYDTSLCFAEHEGFRNSFCLPFKFYDHRNDRMLDTWEIPLVVMDATLFYYRNYSTNKAMAIIQKLLKEVMKFNGVFTLLWHNGFFDEQLYPGIKKFYLEVMEVIKEKQPENLLGHEIIGRVNDCIKPDNYV